MVILQAPRNVEAVEYAGESYVVSDKGFVRVPRVIQDELTRCIQNGGPGFKFPEPPVVKYATPKMVEVTRSILHASKKRG